MILRKAPSALWVKNDKNLRHIDDEPVLDACHRVHLAIDKNESSRALACLPWPYDAGYRILFHVRPNTFQRDR